ncbi:MAG: tyrosine-protein phosphatase [Acidimicrobiaceae bacterium]|nr:tyrosine-protein phosphatase [Acidimicrobiaceae bacterium]
MAETPDARIVVASSNLRDLGGLTTSDGHTVRTGQLFRSGHLCDLGDADRAIVRSLGLQTIVDLRRPAEADVKPHPDLPSVDVVGISVSSDDNEFAVVANAMLDPRAEPLGPDHITNYFRTLVTDHIDRYRPVFDLATDPDRQPLLFNCTAGKDRTGVVAAVLLRILGIDDDLVMADYLLSNEVRRSWIETAKVDHRQRIAHHLGITPAEVPEERMASSRALLYCREDYLRAVLDTAEARWGSWDGFVADGLCLDEARLAAFRTSLLY